MFVKYVLVVASTDALNLLGRVSLIIGIFIDYGPVLEAPVVDVSSTHPQTVLPSLVFLPYSQKLPYLYEFARWCVENRLKSNRASVLLWALDLEDQERFRLKTQDLDAELSTSL